jgi:methylase of polypeptide subunit release factors
MDLENHLFFLLLDNKLHLCPLESPQKILDLGTGTGIWAINIADQYHSAEVIGTDLSPVQPNWYDMNLCESTGYS